MSNIFHTVKFKWIKWLKEEKRFSENTLSSYKRDLSQWEIFIDAKIRPTKNDLRSFLILLNERQYKLLENNYKFRYSNINETLLDIQTLQTIFEDSFDHPGALPQWFTKMLFMSNTLGIVGEYKGFDTLAEEALNQVFMENRKLPSAPTKDLILSQFRQLPPHTRRGH